jgi:hypothetical protein
VPRTDVKALSKSIESVLSSLVKKGHAPRDIGRAWVEAGQSLVADIPPQPPGFYSDLADAIEAAAQRWRREASLLREETRRLERGDWLS